MFSVNGNALTVWVDYFRLTGAQLDLSASGSMGVYLSANYMSIDKSILKGGNWGVYINSGYSGIVIKNSIFQDTVRAPVGLTGTTTDVVEILNCTGWNYNTSNYSNAGFCRLGANGQAKIINTIGVASSVSLINDFTSNYTYASGTGYNCSEDDSAPGSNSIHLDTDGAVLDFVSTTAGSEHFMLKSTSDMVDAGSTVSTVTDDVIGTSRPVNSVYDIGAYEYDPTIGLPVPFTLSNLVLYSRVIIQEQDGTVLYGPVEADSTSETGTLEYFEDITVIVKARRASSELGDGTIYRDFRQEASLTANGLNVYVSQQIDGVLN